VDVLKTRTEQQSQKQTGGNEAPATGRAVLLMFIRGMQYKRLRFVFASTILAARKLIDMDPNKPNMTRDFSWIVLSKMLLSSLDGSMRDVWR
jgi:hypothetical protein